MFGRIHQHLGFDAFCFVRLSIIAFNFIKRYGHVQIVSFFMYEFWQIVFQEFGPFHLGYQVIGYQVALVFITILLKSMDL